ncbi:endonuclease/Exonuclease/phosphatase family protein, partial [Vibrio parahaemolyticus V-223/04]|jgi:hypothetical protein
LV